MKWVEKWCYVIVDGIVSSFFFISCFESGHGVLSFYIDWSTSSLSAMSATLCRALIEIVGQNVDLVSRTRHGVVIFIPKMWRVR